MRLSEIKSEALKLMFLNFEGEDITSDNIKTNNAYRPYLVNMPGAINRAFSNIEEKRVLPAKSVLLSNRVGDFGAFITFDISAMADEICDIGRIVQRTESGEYNGAHEYERVGDLIVIPNDRSDSEYTLLYHPRIPRITSETDDEAEINIPNNIACLIPYFIKGDLYRDDEPNEAGEARNWYEQGMREIAYRNEKKLRGVLSIYSQTEL